MLRSLEIRDIVLIERLDLEPAQGLNALTGETGAGKSILLDALGLALGGAGRADMLRAGAEEGAVAAVFDFPADHPGREILAEAGLSAEDDEVILRRRLSGGRLTGFVNGQRAPAEVLRALGETLVEIHGQHDDRGLLNPRGHRAILDAFAGALPLVDAARAAWDAARRADQALDAARAEAEAAARDAEFLRHAVEELTRLSPEAGEDEALDAERRLIKSAAKIREDVARANQALGADEGAEGRLLDAIRWLDGAADAAEGRLEGALAALDRAMAELGEAQVGVEAALDALAFDPGRLEMVEERLFAIRGLARKHGVAPDDLPALAEDFAARLAAIDGAEAQIADLEHAAKTARAAYETAAARLTEARSEAAGRLDAAVTGELAPLKLERARFETEVAPGAPGPEGVDRVEFRLAANPGAPAGPLARVASGGELSRVLLALKVCLSGAAEGRAMIFDEIDRGVGGATAAAVGARLAALAAAGAQVLVVTHSPQVAARADRHFRIEKSVTDGRTRTDVAALPEAEREAEIARMLAGETVTDAARDAARALLSG
ncbi:DNA repair protein RecN [Albimonas sp. CAU 1670]|uniref:DNA repair protein RecN n=1 Tax=Albimonas sp. CAU 1670 TaxID=3032599 RepID=UPI0023DC9CD4|nr:DNA repair protein RecN [Albimonas sp. CAU 1670]MDF2234889.1 DNA repair protein RecN [Albimonas sp. CAU 1670]